VHTPTKTLLFVIHLPEIQGVVRDKKDYVEYYSHYDNMCLHESDIPFGRFSSAVIYNDYEDFARKVVHYIEFL
jgi:hypothetical protein